MKIKANFNKDKLFFTSDTHFFHKNIISHSKRPFENVNKMNDEMIKRWNEVVPWDGVIFHLGDFSMGCKDSMHIRDILRELHGTKYFCMGNHEHDLMKAWKEFFIEDHKPEDIIEIKVNDLDVESGKQHIVMCHYPMTSWNGAYHGSWQLFGHVHGTLKEHKSNQLDVGVDCHDFYPISYNQLKEKFNGNNNS